MSEESEVLVSHAPALMSAASAVSSEMLLYESAVDLMLAKLRILSGEFRHSGDRSPIDSIQSRVKSFDSIAEKMRRNHIPMNLQALEENILDIAGVRIICPFISDVYRVADMLLAQDDITLMRRKDYIEHPKPNGYRSLHLIVTIDVHLSSTCRQVPVEIQLRTIAMNCWASSEHQLRYKKGRELPPHIAAELQECADIMNLIDRKVERLSEEVLGCSMPVKKEEESVRETAAAVETEETVVVAEDSGDLAY